MATQEQGSKMKHSSQGKTEDVAERRGYEEELLYAQVRSEIEAGMKRRSWLQRQLAVAMRVSEGRVSQMLSGDNLTLKTLAAIGTALDSRFVTRLQPLDAESAAKEQAGARDEAPHRDREEEVAVYEWPHDEEVQEVNLVDDEWTTRVVYKTGNPLDEATGEGGLAEYGRGDVDVDKMILVRVGGPHNG